MQLFTATLPSTSFARRGHPAEWKGHWAGCGLSSVCNRLMSGAKMGFAAVVFDAAWCSGCMATLFLTGHHAYEAP